MLNYGSWSIWWGRNDFIFNTRSPEAIPILVDNRTGNRVISNI